MIDGGVVSEDSQTSSDSQTLHSPADSRRRRGAAAWRKWRDVGWKLVLIPPLAQRHNGGCYYPTIMAHNYLSAPVDADFSLMLPVSQQRRIPGESTLVPLLEGLSETRLPAREASVQSARRRLQATLALKGLLIRQDGTCYPREAAALQTRVRRPSVS